MQEKLDVLILGCGYTGQRVAKRFLARGARVTATKRNPQRLAGLGVEMVSTNDFAAHVRPGMLSSTRFRRTAQEICSIRYEIMRGGSCTCHETAAWAIMSVALIRASSAS